MDTSKQQQNISKSWLDQSDSGEIDLALDKIEQSVILVFGVKLESTNHAE